MTTFLHTTHAGTCSRARIGAYMPVNQHLTGWNLLHIAAPLRWDGGRRGFRAESRDEGDMRSHRSCCFHRDQRIARTSFILLLFKWS